MVSTVSTLGRAASVALALIRFGLYKLADAEEGSNRKGVNQRLGSVVAPSGELSPNMREVLALGYAHGILSPGTPLYLIGQTGFYTDCWAAGLPYPGWRSAGRYE